MKESLNQKLLGDFVSSGVPWPQEKTSLINFWELLIFNLYKYMLQF